MDLYSTEYHIGNMLPDIPLNSDKVKSDSDISNTCPKCGGIILNNDKSYYKCPYCQNTLERRMISMKPNRTGNSTYESSANTLVDDMFFLFFEAGDKDVPDVIEPIVKQLEKKGYQVKYSSPGYPDSTFKNDRNKDGIVNSKLTSSARVIFSRDYKFTSTPQGWEWKVLSNGSKALYVKPYTYNEKWGTGKSAQKKWQVFYMDSLKNWTVSLPNVGEQDKDQVGDQNFNK